MKRLILLPFRLKVFAAIILMALANVSFSQISITGTPATTSNCPNNGSITVNASGGTAPLFYSITAGPSTQPEQTSNVFNSLAPGNYTVRVRDISGNSATRQVTVDGSYIPLTFTPFTAPPQCPGGTDGSITLTRPSFSGFGPFTWEITAPASHIRPPQSSNEFKNLPPGDYTIKLSDGCNSFRTLTTKITDVTSSIVINGNGTIDVTGCDSALVKLDITVNGYSPPYKVVIESGGSVITSFKEEINTEYLPYRIVVTESVKGISYGDDVRITVTDNCNRTVTSQGTVKPFTFCPNLSSTLTDCKYLNLKYSNYGFSCSLPGQLSTRLDPPVKYQLLDRSNGQIVESGTLFTGDPAWGGGITDIEFKKLEYGKNYEVTISDGCNNIFKENYDSPTDPGSSGTPSVATPTIKKGDCLDSTATMTLSVFNFKSPPELVFLSGPAGTRSTKPDFENNNPFTYPDTIKPNSYGGNYHGFTITNLPPGTYQYKIINKCSPDIPGTFVIKPEEVISMRKEDNVFWYKPGCNDKNEIGFYITNGGSVSIRNFAVGFDWSDSYPFITEGDTVRKTIPNIQPGTYYASLNRSQTGGTNLNNNFFSCDPVSEIIEVEQYSAPEIKTYNALLCGSNILAELFPDSTRGVPPFEYEIISGPQTFPRQSSNIFRMNTKGTYRARIYDACGSGSTRDITLEDIDFKPLEAQITCQSARIVYPASAYYTYKWQRPDNTVFTGNSLIIPSLTKNDTGTYHVRQIIEVSGCRDTFYSTHHLNLSESHVKKDTICPGDIYTMGGKIYKTAGKYSDTLTNTAGCDSIVELHLFVRDYLRRTLNIAICPGGSVQVRGKTYSIPGSYKDTIAVPGCDSLLTINITHTSYLTRSVNESICPEGSVTIAGKQYTQAGTYRDTIISGICDSILIIKITQLDYKRGTLNASLCRGKTTTIFGKVYSSPGTFYDTLTTATCDSVVKIIIQEVDYLRETKNISKCRGKSIMIAGKIYLNPGEYKDTLATVTCDSILTLKISDLPDPTGVLYFTKCKGKPISFKGKTYSTGGTFTDTVSTAGCDSILSIVISEQDYIRSGFTGSICPGKSVTAGGRTFSAAGTYSDTLATSGCDSIVTITISPAPVPSVYLGKDTALCKGDKLVLKAGNAFISYIWNDDQTDTTSHSKTENTVGKYWVKVKNIYGCEASDTIEITGIRPLPAVTAQTDTIVCYGASVKLKASGGVKYIWRPGNITTTELSVKPEGTSTYQVIAYDSYGCASLPEDIKVSVFPRPSKAVFSDPGLVHCFAEGPAKIGSERTGTYYWVSTGDTARYINAAKEGSYTVVVTDKTGCPDTASIKIENRCDVILEIPSAFSPNYDGLHDQLEIFGKNFKNFEMRIFNRWGEVIFISTNPEEMWDGFYRGELMPVGSYPWVIEYEPVNITGSTAPGIRRRTGSVTIIR
jgi:gliding motility-associated-like protein